MLTTRLRLRLQAPESFCVLDLTLRRSTLVYTLSRRFANVPNLLISRAVTSLAILSLFPLFPPFTSPSKSKCEFPPTLYGLPATPASSDPYSPSCIGAHFAPLHPPSLRYITASRTQTNAVFISQPLSTRSPSTLHSSVLAFSPLKLATRIWLPSGNPSLKLVSARAHGTTITFLPSSAHSVNVNVTFTLHQRMGY